MQTTGAQRAALLTWTDIPAEEEAAFNEWYNREHVRDRVREVPGFIRGRRFLAIKGAPKYLALYDMETEAVLKSDAYVRIISVPDERGHPCTRRFRNVARTLGRITAAFGEGEGGVIGLWQIVPEEGHETAARAALAETLMPALMQLPGAISCQLIERLPPDDAVSTKRHVRQGDRTLTWALIVEASSEETLEAAQRDVDAAFRKGIKARMEAEMATFRLLYAVSAP